MHRSLCLLVSFAIVLALGCHDGSKEHAIQDQQSEIHQEVTDLSPPATEPVFHPSHEPRKANAPFSDAVQVGDLYFLSGQIGIDNATSELAEGGIEGETRQTMENIKAVLAQHDLELGDVVKALVILDDMADFEAFNGVYRQYLPQKPARTTFAAKGLARDAKIEIEVIAVRSQN